MSVHKLACPGSGPWEPTLPGWHEGELPNAGQPRGGGCWQLGTPGLLLNDAQAQRWGSR